jgi:hypothetical protein
VEEPREVDLAWRFTLSQKGVVAGIPPSFLDLVDKAIDAAKNYRPPTEADLAELQKMAKASESLFAKEESQIAMHGHAPVYPDSPHECGGGHWA